MTAPSQSQHTIMGWACSVCYTTAISGLSSSKLENVHDIIPIRPRTASHTSDRWDANPDGPEALLWSTTVSRISCNRTVPSRPSVFREHLRLRIDYNNRNNERESHFRGICTHDCGNLHRYQKYCDTLNKYALSARFLCHLSH